MLKDALPLEVWIGVISMILLLAVAELGWG